MGKPSGLKTARKLRVHRRDQRWHDLGYKKAHLGTRWKANPFGGSSHAKGMFNRLAIGLLFQVTGLNVTEKYHEIVLLS